METYTVWMTDLTDQGGGSVLQTYFGQKKNSKGVDEVCTIMKNKNSKVY